RCGWGAGWWMAWRVGTVPDPVAVWLSALRRSVGAYSAGPDVTRGLALASVTISAWQWARAACPVSWHTGLWYGLWPRFGVPPGSALAVVATAAGTSRAANKKAVMVRTRITRWFLPGESARAVCTGLVG